MTTEEKESRVGHTYLELEKAKADHALARGKLGSLREQIRAVLDDWDRLYVVNESQLSVKGPSRRSLPTEAEIAVLITEIEGLKQRVQSHQAELDSIKCHS